jgi:hypothetical protein
MKMNIGLIRFGILVICLASLALGVVHYNKVGGVIFDLSDYLTLDQSTPQTITGDTFKLDVLKSKSILGTDSDGKIIEGTHQDLSGYVPYTGATDDVDLGANNLTVDTNTLFVDSVNDRVGIGTTTPASELDVDGTISATKILGVKNAINTVSTNLGTPTVEEMALFQAQFNNKFQFKTPDLQEESTDGTTWTTSTKLTSDQLQDLMVGNGNANGWKTIITPTVGNDFYYRLTFDATSYVFLNQLYVYITTASKSVNIKIEKYDATDTTWEEVTNGYADGWPTHVHIPHTLILYNPSVANSNHRQKVRVTFSITNSPNTHPVKLGSMEWWGGYPAAKRDIFSLDRDKGATFPAEVRAYSGFVAYDNIKSFYGTDKDATIYYDTTNLVINPKEVGSGILSVLGGMAVDTDVLFVDSVNDRVGIGTATPRTNLDTNGVIRAVGGSYTAVPGTGSDTKTDVGVVIPAGMSYSGEWNGYIRNLIKWDSDDRDIDIGQSGTALITNINLIAGTTGNIKIPRDNSKLYFGAGSDASIKYDGTNLVLDSGSGVGYFSGNVSATGYITRTDVFDKSTGMALDLVHDASYYINEDNKIDHSKFEYSYVKYNTTDFSRPLVINKEREECDPMSLDDGEEYYEVDNLVCEIISYNETTYPHKIVQSGVDLVKESSLLKQALYEIKTFVFDTINRVTIAEARIAALEAENDLIKQELCNLGSKASWCMSIIK